MESNYFVAPSFQNLPTVGNVFEENGKEYIYVMTTSGKTRKVRAYKDEPVTTSHKNRVFYDVRTELGFAPVGYIYLIRCEDEAELKHYCRFDPRFGAYIPGKNVKDILEIPYELKIDSRKLYWTEICQNDCIHLLPDSEVKAICDNKYPH